MKLVLLVAASAIAGTLAADYVLQTDFVKKQIANQEPGTIVALRTGATAGFGVLTFAVLNRFL